MKRFPVIGLMLGLMSGALALVLVRYPASALEGYPGGIRAWYPFQAPKAVPLEWACATAVFLTALWLILELAHRSGFLRWVLEIRYRRLEGELDPVDRSVRFLLLALLGGCLWQSLWLYLAPGPGSAQLVASLHALLLQGTSVLWLGFALMVGLRGGPRAAVWPAAALAVGLGLAVFLGSPIERMVRTLVEGWLNARGPWWFLAGMGMTGGAAATFLGAIARPPWRSS